MPVAKFSCPECDAVLKPSKPVPEGKKVKCPKCGAAFTVPAEIKQAIAPKPAAPRPKPAPVKKKASDDDDEGSYGLINEPEHEAEEEQDEEQEKKKDRKGDLTFKEDNSVKDPRGPAQAALVMPSNMLLITGVVGVLSWFLLIILIIIPAAFPPVAADDDEDPQNRLPVAIEVGHGIGAAAESSSTTILIKPPFPFEPQVAGGALYKMVGLTFIATIPRVLAVLLVLPFALGCLYSCLIVAGAVKIQSMESRAWGKVASILAMIPLNAGPLMLISLSILWQLSGLIFDPPDVEMKKKALIVLLGVCEVAWGIRVGYWNLRTLAKPVVIEGFEYQPD